LEQALFDQPADEDQLAGIVEATRKIAYPESWRLTAANGPPDAIFRIGGGRATMVP